MERWGPNGSIKRLGQFFLDTEQVDLLRQLYDTVYSFCKDLFRTYDPPTDKYNWLREFREEKLTDEEAILELFKHAGAFEDNDLQALRAISSSKDIRNYVELSVYDIIEGNTQ